MAMANMNLIGVFVTELWPVQALACGGGDGGGDGGGATKNIISPKFSNFWDIIMLWMLEESKQGFRIGDVSCGAPSGAGDIVLFSSSMAMFAMLQIACDYSS